MKKFISFLLTLAMTAGALGIAIPAGAAKIVFSDVGADRWSASSIEYAVKEGYMKGVGGGLFDPEGPLTRAMVATVLWRREGSPAPTAPGGFTDVPDGEWYTDAVAWAKETGVVKGLTMTTFGPDEYITREQLATMLFRFSSSAPVSVPERADLAPFADDEKVSDWADEPLEWAVEAGLINGTDGNRLAPDGFATREQFAAIIERYDGSFKLVYNEPILRSHYTEKEYPLVTDADFYVAVDGDDSADGSFAHPFRTWERARDAVRTLDKTGRSGIKVAFMAGEYGPLDISLTSEDSGTPECPITYCKYGDGDAVFNNGVTLRKDGFAPISDGEAALFPEKSRDHIKKLDLGEYFPDGMPDGLALFGDKGPVWEARYPNKTPEGEDWYLEDTLTVPTDRPNYYGMEINGGPMARLIFNKVNYIKNMKMTGYIMYGWRVDTFYVTDYDKETGTITLDETRLPGDFRSVGIRTPQMKLDEIYYENSPDFLDGEGEYWYDPDSNRIYFYDPCDEYTIGLGESFVTLNGADNVTLRGLSFINSRDGTSISVNDSADFTADRCLISGVYRPFEVNGSSDRFTVTDCEFSRFIANCIRLRPTCHWTTLESNHVLIDNNYFHDYGLSKLFGNAAISDSSIGAVISHNVFENSPNNAINMGTLSLIEYNVFENMMSSTQDFGVVYANSTYTEGRHNTVRYNLFGRMNDMNGATYGLYMDDYTQDQYIYGNLFYRCGGCGVMLHLARDQFVYENAFVFSGLSTNDLVHYYDGKVQGGLLPDGTGWKNLYDSYYNARVNEGEEGYEIWREKFPSLYAFEPLVDNPYVYESFFCPWDSIHNNALIGSRFTVLEDIVKYGEVYDNEFLTESDNPYFVNPTVGDYRLRDGVDFFSIPFEKMGRY